MDPLELVAERFFGTSYLHDPTAWAQEKLGVHLWSKQQEIAESVVKHRYTAVRSSHDGGKSFVAAILSLWWNDVHTLGDSFVVSTAPTATQVTVILWREIQRWHARGKLAGRINMGSIPEWWVDKEQIAYGRKPSDYDASGFQGVHALYPLIIIDEACGIPKQLWTAVDALATNINARVLAIGNPDDPSTHFEEVCRPGSGWNVIELDGLRTPNFTEETVRALSTVQAPLYDYMMDYGIPFSTEEVPDRLRLELLSVEWVLERMPRWGVTRSVDDDGKVEWKSSSLWESKVRGRFPTDATEGVIPLGWVEEAQRRWIEQQGTEPFGRRKFSVDVARFGEDETAIAEGQGHVIFGVSKYGKQDTMTTANIVDAKLKKYPRSYCTVDVIGVGAGVVDRLNELEHNVTQFSGAVRTRRTDLSGMFTFPNVRSAAWWNLRELLDPSRGARIALPPDDELAADLTAPRWKLMTGGKIVVEEKDDTRKRLGRSPDKGDTICMYFWEGDDTAEGDEEGYSQEYGGVSEFAAPYGSSAVPYADV